MKKTVTCLAMIVSATAVAKPTAPTEQRDPAAIKQGYTFAGCQPRKNLFKGDDAYKNECIARLSEIEVPALGMGGPRNSKEYGCDDNHYLIVSSTPLRFACIPPGAMEL